MKRASFFKRFLDYLGTTWFIHAYLWAVLTPWFFFALDFTIDQYITWIWQAPILALATNYPMGLLIERFIPWYRKKIKYKN